MLVFMMPCSFMRVAKGRIRYRIIIVIIKIIIVI